MVLQCPRCGSKNVVKVGQYGTFLAWGFGGTVGLALIGAAYFVFMPLIPFWWVGCLAWYLRHPLLECDDCHLEWDPHRPPSLAVGNKNETLPRTGKR